MTRKIQINFDMDGTLVDFYGVEGWLDDLINRNTRPYAKAAPRVNFSALARVLNRLQREGFEICIISWLAKNSTEEFDKAVAETKIKYLAKHLPSVKWDRITIVPYGTPKSTCGMDILFDDEESNRKEWKGKAYDVNNILEVLKNL
jgi:hypothetical protein